jgi:hypothetical protein
MKSGICSSVWTRYAHATFTRPPEAIMKRPLNPASIRAPFAQYSHAVEVPAGRMVFASGQLGVSPDDRVPEDAEAQAVKKYGPLYVKDAIPAKAYPGQEAANQIVTVWNVLVARADMTDKLAYDIVKTLFERKEDMVRVHKDAQYFDFRYQTNAAAVIPFHPGAVKYFREKGLDVK